MTAARRTVSTNIQVLMDNSTPKASQTMIADVIALKQPQVSQRLRGFHPWGIDELEKIAEFFGVDLTLLVESDPSAVYRWLAENGSIDLRDKQIGGSNCDHAYGQDEPRLFDPDKPPDVIDLRERILNQTTQKDSLDLYAIAN